MVTLWQHQLQWWLVVRRSNLNTADQESKLMRAIQQTQFLCEKGKLGNEKGNEWRKEERRSREDYRMGKVKNHTGGTHEANDVLYMHTVRANYVT